SVNVGGLFDLRAKFLEKSCRRAIRKTIFIKPRRIESRLLQHRRILTDNINNFLLGSDIEYLFRLIESIADQLHARNRPSRQAVDVVRLKSNRILQRA